MRYAAIPIAKAKATVQDIETLAAKYEPAIAKAIFTALEAQVDEVNLDALAAALEKGDLASVMNMLQLEKANFGAATHAMQDAAWAGGLMATKGIAAMRGIEFAFDRLNPVLIQWLQTYSLGLIRQINDGTRDAVRSALTDGMRAGKNPRKVATHIKQTVGLTTRQQQAVANFRNELETFHARKKASAWNLGAKIDRVNGFQVFKPDEAGDPKDGIKERRLRDFRHDAALKQAMATGKPLKPEQIDKMVEAYARKYRKYRAETIARTEAMRATNMGTQEAWRQAVGTGKVPEALVRRFWKVGKDERTCKVCNAIPKLNDKGVTLGAPFATPKGPLFMPPQHPDCRCHLFIRLMEPAQLGLPQFAAVSTP